MFGAIHWPSFLSGAASRAAIIAVRVTFEVWSAGAVVPASISFRIIITHCHVARAVLAIILGATLRATRLVALIIGTARADAFSKKRGR